MSHHRRRWGMVLAALFVISRRDFRCEDGGKVLKTNFCLIVAPHQKQAAIRYRIELMTSMLLL